jgi:hypothetical protein
MAGKKATFGMKRKRRLHAGDSAHPGRGLEVEHGGIDSRKMPGAQTAQEAAQVIAGLIDHPRADAYTRPGAQQIVVGYYAAEDMGLAEQQPLFVPARPPR